MTRREEVDEEANEQGLMLNIYDKILSWAEFVNVQRPFDDDPENDNSRKADEMEELTTTELKRSTNTFFDADLEREDSYADDNSGDDQKAGKVYLYHEWDYRNAALQGQLLDGNGIYDNSRICQFCRRRFKRKVRYHKRSTTQV